MSADRRTDRRAGGHLTDWEPDGEEKIVAAALYASTELPDSRLRDLARELSATERAEVLRAYVGERANRRHKPAEPSSAPATASTCSATTAPSGTSSGTGL